MEEPGDDVISIRHHFSLPNWKTGSGERGLQAGSLGDLSERPILDLFGDISPEKDETLHRVAVFDKDHTHARIYSPNEDIYYKGNLGSH